MPPAYAELHCRSCFSFLTGASRPPELVAEAQRRGYAALAITDECSLSGVVHAHEAALEARLPLVIGAQMNLSPAPTGDGAVLAAHGPPRLVLLAQTRRGYGNLAQWISVARRRAPKGQYQAHAGDLEGRVPHAPFLAGLPGCFAILLPQPGQSFESVHAQAMWLKTWFGPDRCAIAVELLGHPQDAQRLAVLPRVADHTGLPLVACGDVLMHARARKPLQDALTATRLGCTVAAAGLALAPNAEAHLRSRQRLARLYAPAWLAASVAIAASCSFSLAELRYEYPDEIVPAGHEEPEAGHHVHHADQLVIGRGDHLVDNVALGAHALRERPPCLEFSCRGRFGYQRILLLPRVPRRPCHLLGRPVD